MKFLILACALACASATYTGPEHTPVINAQGFAVDTAEVQQAKAEHFAAKAQVSAHDGHYYPHFYNAQYPHFYNSHYPQFYNAHYPYFYNSQYAYNYAPYAFVNKDVPAETPEVVAAKISHFAAHAEANARSGHRERRGVFAYTAHTPVVAHAPIVAHAPVVAHTPVAHAYSAYPYASTTYTHKY